MTINWSRGADRELIDVAARLYRERQPSTHSVQWPGYFSDRNRKNDGARWKDVGICSCGDMHENTAHGLQRAVLGECQRSVTGPDGRVIS